MREQEGGGESNALNLFKVIFEEAVVSTQHHIYMFTGLLYLICNCVLTYVTFNKPSK